MKNLLRIVIVLVVAAAALYIWESRREKTVIEKGSDLIDDTVGELTGEGPLERTGRKLDRAIIRGKEKLEDLSPKEREDILDRVKKQVGEAVAKGAETVKKQAEKLGEEDGKEEEEE